MEQEEKYFKCPYCWERISMLVDLSIESQTFIEDCEVCCNPIQISYISDEGGVTGFRAEKIQ